MVNIASTAMAAFAQRVKRGGVIINEHTLSKADTTFHVEVLSRWFDFIKLADLQHRLDHPAKRPFCVLTFDDGKRSNFSETAPELERLGVPAVFYVSTDPLTTGSSFWFDRHAQLVKAVGHCPPGLELASLKQLPFDQLMGRLERACVQYSFEPGEESDDMRPMSWTEVRNLHRRGFTIGAHGTTHAILTRETRARAFAEIEESLAKVRREVGAPCDTFAFPNGNYNSELTQHAVHCGARTVMTTDPMWVDQDVPLWQLPRIQLFNGFTSARIEAKVALAAFNGVLKNPDGSGREYSPPPRKVGALAALMLVCGMRR